MRAILLSITMVGLVQSISAQEPKMKSESDHQIWAIAIHGGAGGEPSRWSPQKREAREKGLMDALSLGKKRLAEGANALEVVEAVIRRLEDDASFNAGRGSVLTKAGHAELDASLMNGQDLSCGAVAGVRNVKNPISLARRVMNDTPHVLLMGDGAEEFAERSKVELVEPSYFFSRVRLEKRANQTGNVASLPVDKHQSSDEKHFGTVGCVVRDRSGNLAAGTSTGGTSKKLEGRVGDSPIVGAGTYADNRYAAVSGTGIGEEYIRNAVAYDVIARIKYRNDTLADAVSSNLSDRLEEGTGGLIAVSPSGEIVMQHNTPGMSCAAADNSGRFECFFSVP